MFKGQIFIKNIVMLPMVMHFRWCSMVSIVIFYFYTLDFITWTFRCAWLGELDSAEESDEISNEFDFKNEVCPAQLIALVLMIAEAKITLLAVFF